ncbi:diaminopimelate decarboxylase [Nocardiopsis lucentensis]|uniref:diaminopimelate decarboxylase n=1 Tax=Nocardiopsis lucentensis TaxID=53441 RepID=UPI000688A466|nr:diaminopimelate decarboxylase [Nocardiopsis lucentensis]
MNRPIHPAEPQSEELLAPTPQEERAPGVWPRNAHRSNGVMEIAGHTVTELAREFGTPLFVLDEEDFRSRCREYVRAFHGGDVYYAGKSFLCTAVARWVVEEGLNLDVCSEGELAVALHAQVPPHRISMHGNNKSLTELEQAIEVGVGRVVVDSFTEIDRLSALAESRGRRQRVLVRVTTGVEAHTHEYIATAHDDQKFGFALSTGMAAEAVRRVLAAPGLDLAGLHSHIGSQVLSLEPFEVAAARLVALLGAVKDEHGVELAELNLGGGRGITYVPGEFPTPVASFAEGLRRAVRGACREHGIAVPRLAVEPGRAVVGPGTVTLYEVGTVKDVTGVRRFVSVDGGMSDNIRPALYGAPYTCDLVSRDSAAAPVPSRVVGSHCESGDVLVPEARLPGDLAPGDLLAVAATGAYCRSMANNYNHALRPGVVAVREGRARAIVRRETVQDLLRTDTGVGDEEGPAVPTHAHPEPTGP